MKDTTNSPLRERPSIDSRGLLNDPRQLRELVRNQAQMLSSIAAKPTLAREPGFERAMKANDLLLHYLTCTDCADLREAEGVSVPSVVIAAMGELFLAYVTSEDAQNEADARMEQQAEDLLASLSPAERGLLEVIGSALGMGANPMFN